MSDAGSRVDDDVQAVLDFWFGPPGSEAFATQRKIWFAKDAAFDRLVAKRFGGTIEQALRGELDRWADASASALARILLLDQFTRNAFRDQARAYAGDAQAQLDLANAYLTGKDTAKDERMGLSYLEKSARQGLPRAQFEMGEHIVHQAAPVDYSKAYMWYTLARRGGDKHSEKALKELSAKMTPEQVQAGQVLVDGWTNVPANNGSPK